MNIGSQHKRRNKVIGSKVTYYSYLKPAEQLVGRVLAKTSTGYIIRPPIPYGEEVYRTFEEIIE